MGKALRIFFLTEGANPWVVVACLFASGFFEGVSIASLLPALTMTQGGSGGKFGRLFGGLLQGYSFDTTISILLGMVVVAIGLKSLLSYIAMRYVGYAVAEVST